MENYYQILGLSPSTSTDEIEKRIHSELRIWNHRINAPQIDRRQEAERMVHILEVMEEILLDEQRRKQYDQQLDMWMQSSATTQVLQSKDRIQEMLFRGKSLLNQGNAQEALQLAEKLVQEDESKAESWFLLARVYCSLDQLEEAIRPLKRACELEPDSAKYHFHLGEMLAEQDQFDFAEQELKRAIFLDPLTNRYPFALGRLYLAKGRWENGLRLLEQCYQEEPESPTIAKELGLAYLQMAFLSWRKVSECHKHLSEGVYPIARSDIAVAEEYIKRAKKMPVIDEELAEEIKQAQQELGMKKGRQFTGSWIFLMVSFANLVLVYDVMPSQLNMLFIGILPLLYYWSAYKPRYRIYEKALRGERTGTDIALLFDWLQGKIGIYRYLISVVLLFPYYMFYPYPTFTSHYFGMTEVIQWINPYFYLVNVVLSTVIVYNLFFQYRPQKA